MVEEGYGQIVPCANDVLHLLCESLDLSRKRLRDLEDYNVKMVE